jgi:hypothetical protein
MVASGVNGHGTTTLRTSNDVTNAGSLIDDIAENGEATTDAEADARPVPDFTSDNVREDCLDQQP